MDALVRQWTMTALEAARRSERARTEKTPNETKAQAELPVSLGRAGASVWSRWIAQREAGATGDGPERPG
jgi:hypothetical protein